MISLSGDPAWTRRLRSLAARGGWPFATELAPSADHHLIVLDGESSGPLRETIAGHRGRLPSSRVVLALSEAHLGAANLLAGLDGGADDVVGKSWPDERLFARLSALRDAALADAVLTSADGALKAERRSHRAYVRARGRWSAVDVPAAEFALLWSLLSADGAAVSRERLLDALRGATGRDVEAETVARRVLSLRRALKSWKGRVEAVRGGFYRLSSAGR